jgi:hypothetical protein
MLTVQGSDARPDNGHADDGDKDSARTHAGLTHHVHCHGSVAANP